MALLDLPDDFYSSMFIEERSDVVTIITIPDDRGSVMYFTGYASIDSTPIFSYHKVHSDIYMSEEEAQQAIIGFGLTGLKGLVTKPIYFIS